MKTFTMQFIKILNFIKFVFMMLILFLWVSDVKLFLPGEPGCNSTTISMHPLKIPINIFL